MSFCRTRTALSFDGFANELFMTEGAVPQENDLLSIQFLQEIGGTSTSLSGRSAIGKIIAAPSGREPA